MKNALQNIIFTVLMVAVFTVITSCGSKSKPKPTPKIAPQITSTAPITATVGFQYSYVISTTGTPAPTLSITGLPTWLTFDGVATLSGTPSVGDNGLSETITIIANNGVNPNAVKTFTITVLFAPVAPVITSVAPINAITGIMYSYTITTSGLPTPSLSVSNLPSWLSFNNTTSTISGVPTYFTRFIKNDYNNCK